jgi:hypothetical protein
MADLERTLASLELDWPPTPAFDLRQPARRRWPLALVALVVAIAVAFAVPPARGAILRFFHLRGASIERVRALPPATRAPLAAMLGTPIGQRSAATLLGRPFGLRAKLYRSGLAVSALISEPEPVLLTEIRTGVDSPLVLKKFVSGATSAVVTAVGRDPAVWLSGGEHVAQLVPSVPRLADNVLLWTHGTVLFRLEGAALSLERARGIAAQVAAR